MMGGRFRRKTAQGLARFAEGFRCCWQSRPAGTFFIFCDAVCCLMATFGDCNVVHAANSEFVGVLHRLRCRPVIAC